MAASITVKLEEDGSVEDLFSNDVKKYFNHTAGETKGELTLKSDASVTIAYNVKDDGVTFMVKQSPKLFNDGDWKGMLKELFG